METMPPPIIATARLIKYANSESPIFFTGIQRVYVGTELIGHVPRLAICVQITDGSNQLYLCDKEWNVLAAVGGKSVPDLLGKAARWYNGIEYKWIETPYSEEDSQKYLENERGEARCSFCRRWDWEYATLSSEEGTNICDYCVRRFFNCLSLQEGGRNQDEPNEQDFVKK